MENIMLLDLILRHQHEKHRQVYSAVLDMQKAFDSVTFETLAVVMEAKGLPRELTYYILNIYNRGTTKLQPGGLESKSIHPTCGVKQGDPLSPLLLNFVIDEIIKKLPPHIGVNHNGLKINMLAFADDLVLVAQTQTGLQHLINQTISFLRDCELSPNIGKCATLAMHALGRKKKTVIDPTCEFTREGKMVRALNITDEWKYLGVGFTALGRVFTNVRKKLSSFLSRPSTKPQQKLWALRTIAIPRIMYQLVMGEITFGYLRAADKKIRQCVREWLRLPHDTPNSYFHAAIKDGGLGIQLIRWRVPFERRNRLNSLCRSTYIVGSTAETYISKQLRLSEKRLLTENGTISSKSQIDQLWASSLHAFVDGKVKFIERNLTRMGYEVTYEPKYRTSEGLRKPDLMQ